jgi:uncharacterized membrane protein
VTAAPVRRYASLTLIAIAAVMLSSSVLCTWLVAHGWSAQWRVLFRLVCHGLPSRCLVLFGTPMPICARCTAIYGGLIAGALLFRITPEMRERTARIIAIVAALPMGFDGGTQLIRLRESTNVLRVETGLVFGIALAVWVLTAARASAQVTVHQSFEAS